MTSRVVRFSDDFVLKELLSLGEQLGIPTAGDVIFTYGWHFVIDGSDDIELRTDDRRERLERNDPLLGWQTIGLRISDEWTRPDERVVPVVRRLPELTPAERQQLRVIQIEKWHPELEAWLEAIDLRLCLVMIRNNLKMPNPGDLYWLPAGLRYLAITSVYSPTAFTELPSLRRFPELQFLHCEGQPLTLDFVSLNSSRELRHLSAVGPRFRNTGASTDLQKLTCLSLTESPDLRERVPDFIGGLGRLRHIELSWCRNLKDIGFAARLQELEILDIQGTGVSDLSPLGALARLRTVHAELSPVRTLPTQRLPALEYLNLLATGVSRAAADGFQQRHRDATVDIREGDLLKRAVAGFDNLRVVGPPNPESGAYPVRFEVRDPIEMDELLAILTSEVVDVHWDEPAPIRLGIEFRRADAVLTTVMLREGEMLEWAGCVGAVFLDHPAMDRLADWLAQRDLGEVSQQVTAGRRRGVAFKSYRERLAALLPPRSSTHWSGPVELLDSSTFELEYDFEGDGQRLMELLIEELPREVDRVCLAFRLIGTCPVWGHYALWTLDMVAEQILGSSTDQVRQQAIRECLLDPVARDGVVLWLLQQPEWPRGKSMDRAMREAWRLALTHPVSSNREIARMLLRQSPDTRALPALQSLQRGSAVQRPAPEELEHLACLFELAPEDFGPTPGEEEEIAEILEYLKRHDP